MTDDYQMNKILLYLDRNIGDKHTLVSISDRFGMSERSMSRLFRSTLDISFLQYLKTLRMVKAIELILKSHKSINEIADEVGYSSISTFSDTFHEFTQSRPSDLRKTKACLKTGFLYFYTSILIEIFTIKTQKFCPSILPHLISAIICGNFLDQYLCSTRRIIFFCKLIFNSIYSKILFSFVVLNFSEFSIQKFIVLSSFFSILLLN